MTPNSTIRLWMAVAPTAFLAYMRTGINLLESYANHPANH